MNNNCFSIRLRELRKSNNLSQKTLGEAIGLSMQAINDIENSRNNTTLEKAIAIADYFNVSLDYLVGRTDNQSCHVENKYFFEESAPLESDKKELLLFYNTLNDFSKGILIENARILMEKQSQKVE